MAKQPTKKELFDAAVAKDAEAWSAKDALKRLVSSKMAPPAPAPAPQQMAPAAVPPAAPQQPMPQGQGMKKGGKVMGHTHQVDMVKKHAAGGHMHHSSQYGKHAAGHKMFHDHVKKMCGGGKTK